MDIYEYEPIDLDRPAVRLLRLLKGSSGDTIECDLFQGWIDRENSGMPYDALSYTWGSTERAHIIRVGGKLLHVTSNLYSALQHLRLEREDKILWIDAICIDQDNLKERKHQVQHMSDVYKEAEHVLVWLGDSTKETDLLMGAMRRLEERLVEVSGDWRHSANLWIQPWIDSQSVPGEESSRRSDSLIRGMQSILGRPWFRRIWVLQEIANSKVATIICGEKSISARIFAQIPSLIGLKPDPHCQAILDIMPGFSRKESWWIQDRSLHNLLRKFGRSEATDERDIIYALLGISSDASESDILLPDYTKSLRKVISDTVSYLISPWNKNHVLLDSLDWNLKFFLKRLDLLIPEVLPIACKNGSSSLESVLRAINEVPTSSAHKSNLTPLQLEVENGHREKIRILLEKGKPEGNTPLSIAVQSGRRELIDLLLQSGAEVGWKPLPCAVEQGHAEVVKLLIEDALWPRGSTSVLHMPKRELFKSPKQLSDSAIKKLDVAYLLVSAISHGHKDIVELLLGIGAEGNAKSKESTALLHLATKLGTGDIVKLLLERGAQVDTLDKYLRSPLSYATERGAEETVKILLDGGAEVDLACKSGRSPLSYTSGIGRFPTIAGRMNVAKLLLAKGANVNSIDSEGYSPLTHAAERGQHQLVQLLLDNGADPNHKSKNGHTPIEHAARYDYPETIRILRQSGVITNLKDTHLYMASTSADHSRETIEVLGSEQHFVHEPASQTVTLPEEETKEPNLHEATKAPSPTRISRLEVAEPPKSGQQTSSTPDVDNIQGDKRIDLSETMMKKVRAWHEKKLLGKRKKVSLRNYRSGSGRIHQSEL